MRNQVRSHHNNLYELLEMAYVVVMIAYYCGALQGASWNGSYNPGASNYSAFIVHIVLYAISILVWLLHSEQVAAGLSRARYVVAFGVYAAVSTVWSTNAIVNLRRSIWLVLLIIWGVYFGSRFTLREQIRILAYSLMLLLVSCAVAAIFWPSVGMDVGPYASNWRGIFAQKNDLAFIAALSVLVLMNWNTRSMLIRMLGIGLALFELAMTRSGTGISVLCVTALSLLLYRLKCTKIRLRAPLMFVNLAALGLVVLIPFLSAQGILSFMHRDVTLTGRTMLWRMVISEIKRSPLLGYGLYGYWNGMLGESRRTILAVGWPTPNAHNGWLDLWLELGMVGVVLFLIIIFHLLRKGVLLCRTDLGAGVWLLTFLLFSLTYNMTESFWTNTVILVIISAAMANNSKSMKMVPINYSCAGASLE